MERSANIIPFPSDGRTPSPNDAGSNLSIQLNEYTPRRNTAVLDSSGLYPLGGPSDRTLKEARDLLEKASDLISKAIDDFDAKDFIEADQMIQEFERLLPKQFILRYIGDGYGELIRSMWAALVNKKGEPLDRRQLVAINGCIFKLKNDPKMQFLDAVKLCATLDAIGLVTKHNALADFADSIVELLG